MKRVSFSKFSMSSTKFLTITAVVWTLVVALCEYSWIRTDTRLQPVVDEWVEKTLNLRDGLQQGGGDFARHIYWASLGPRPPSYPLLAQGPLATFSRSVDTILLVNVLCLVVLGLACFQLGNLIHGPAAGLIATFLATTYPVVSALTKLVRPHVLIAPVSALALLAFISLISRSATKGRVWILAATQLLLFATHPAAFLSLLPASIAAAAIIIVSSFPEGLRPLNARRLVGLLFDVTKSDIFIRAALPALLVLLLVLGGWIYLKIDQYRALAKVSAELFAPMYGRWHYETTIWSALGMPQTILFAASIVTIVLMRKRLTKDARRGCAFLVWSCFGAFAIVHFQTGAKGWQTMTAVVPISAALIGVAIAGISNGHRSGVKVQADPSKLSTLLVSSVFLISMVAYFSVNWLSPHFVEILKPFTGIASRCDGLSYDSGSCSNTPKGGDWKVSELISTLVAETGCRTIKCRVAVLGHRQKYFSDEALQYSLVMDFPYASRLVSTAFYPVRRFSFERVKGDYPQIEKQLSDSKYVIVLTRERGNSQDLFGLPNTFMTDEFGWTNRILDDAAASSGSYHILFTSKLPSAEVITLLRNGD